jgi:hypothetical protein
MKHKLGILSGGVAATLSLALFTGAALAGGNGNGNSASAPGQVVKAATPAAQTQAAAPAPAAPTHGNSASAPGHASKPSTSTHGGGSAAQNSPSVAGVKPTNATSHSTHTTVGASPNVSKRYGNGQTAAGIAASHGAPADTPLFGPGNSQPHKVTTCQHPLHGNGGGVDVHAVKNYTATCATQTQAPTPQVAVSKVCGAVTTASTTVETQRGHAYGLLKQGKALHTKVVTVTVTLPTGEVCTVTAPTQQAAQQQATQLLTQALGTAPTQQQLAAAVKTEQATSVTPHGAKFGVLGAEVSRVAAAKAAPARSRGGVLGATASLAGGVAHGTLPFTGFPIWVALVIAAVLVALGLALATRRRSPRDVV